MKIITTDANIHKQFFTQCGDDMRQLAEPLLPLGIVYFGYNRLYADQSRARLTTHPDYTILYIKERFYEQAFGGALNQYQSGFYFYDELNHSAKDKEILQTIRNASIEHDDFKLDFLIIDKQATYADFFWFGTPSAFTTLYTFYLNNLAYLQNYILQLKESGRHIFKEAHRHQYIYPTSGNDKTLLGSAEWQKQMCLNDLSCQHNSVLKVLSKSLCEKSLLTCKESLVAACVQQGFIPKQIAVQMHISVRTVEKHIEHIKQKFGSRNLLHLVTQLLRED